MSRTARTRRKTDHTSAFPPGLNLSQYEFCLNYVANGFNATAAYKAAYPEATPRSARELGYRLLTKVDIKAFLATQLAEGWEALQMDGDEALGRVAQHARADIRLFYDEKGQLLDPRDWPDEIAGSVKAIKDGPYGKTITLVDPLSAQRIILEQTGKLKSPTGEGLDALAEAIRADQARYSKA